MSADPFGLVQPRLVRRCLHPACRRLTLWQACGLHRGDEMTSASRARCAGVKPWPLVPAVFKPTSSGAGRLAVANPAGDEDETS